MDFEGYRAKTVGELIEVLQQFPADTPLHHRGNFGDFPQGVTISPDTLAVSLNDRGFTLSKNDPVWSKSKIKTSDAFKALVFWK